MSELRSIVPDRARWDGEQFADAGELPKLAWLPVAKLRVDDTYQRPITAKNSRANIDRIVRGFSWAKFGTVMVAAVKAPGGSVYAIIDGQHRAAAAAERGIAEVPCQIVSIDQAGQAAAFAAINGAVTPMTVFHVFKAARAAGIAWALAIDRACGRAGVTPLVYPVSAALMKDNETLAIGTLRQMLERHGEDALSLGLSCMVASAGNAPGLINANRIKLAVSLIAAHADWQAAREILVASFSRINLWRYARDERAALESEVNELMGHGGRPPERDVHAPGGGRTAPDDAVRPAPAVRRRTELARGKGRAGEWW